MYNYVKWKFFAGQNICGTSVLARNCKPSGAKVYGPCKCTVWLGSVWLHHEYHNCYSTQVVQKGFLELTKWCTRQAKWCAPLRKGLARTLHRTTISLLGCTHQRHTRRRAVSHKTRDRQQQTELRKSGPLEST